MIYLARFSNTMLIHYNMTGVMDDVSRQLTEVYDDFPVTSLAYANGPGPTKREDMFGVDTSMYINI